MLQFDWLEFLIYQKDSPYNFHSFPLNLIIVIFLDSYIIYDSGNVTWGLPSVGFDYWVFGTIVELLQISASFFSSNPDLNSFCSTVFSDVKT